MIFEWYDTSLRTTILYSRFQNSQPLFTLCNVAQTIARPIFAVVSRCTTTRPKFHHRATLHNLAPHALLNRQKSVCELPNGSVWAQCFGGKSQSGKNRPKTGLFFLGNHMISHQDFPGSHTLFLCQLKKMKFPVGVDNGKNQQIRLDNTNIHQMYQFLTFIFVINYKVSGSHKTS
jgi:hypothetical protein